MRKHLEKLKEHSKKASIKFKEHSNKLFNSLKSKHVATLVEPITNYKEIFLYSFIALFLVHIYAVFFKSPQILPGLEERTFLFLVPLFVLTVLFYTPWGKIVSKISELKLISKISELHLLKKLKLKERAHSFEYFLQNLSIHSIKESLNNEKVKNFTKYAFLFFLLLVTLSSLKFEQTLFLSKPLVEIQFPLTIITIILGALTFWQNKEVIEEIEEEQNNEKKEGEKRALEFSEKYPKLAKIPLVNKVTKWMYKEGKWYSIAVISLIIIGFLIRLYRLGDLGLWWDELYTGTYVLRILETGFPLYPSGWGYYWRGVAYHYFVSIFTFLFGVNEFWIRFPSVLFGMGIAISAFFLTKKINKNVAILVLLFLVFSTFNIEYSRFARFYVMNAFLFMIAIWTFWLGFFKNKLKHKIISIILFSLMLHTVQTGAIFVSLVLTWSFFFAIKAIKNMKNLKELINKNSTDILLISICIPVYFLGNIFEKFIQIELPLPLAKEFVDVISSRAWDFIQVPVWSLFEFLNENHINTIFIVLFFIMFVIVLYKNKLKLKKTFFNYLFILTIFAILLFEIGNRGVTGARIVFLFEALIIILFFLLIYIVAKILFKKNNIQIYFVAILVGLLFFNITPFFYERININYGDDVSNDPFRSTHVAAYRADYKTTSEFVLKNSSESDIIITLMSTNYFYLRRNADYYLNQNVRWNTNSLFDGNNFISLTSSSIILNSPEDINSIIKNNLNKKIWLLVNGASINILSTTHVRKDFINFIKNNEDKLIYISPDGESKIFLFNQ